MGRAGFPSTLGECVLLSLLLFLPGAAVHAENQAGQTNITFFAGGYTFDHDLDLQTGFTGGLGIGYNLTDRWGIELEGHTIGSNYHTGSILSERHRDRQIQSYLYRLDVLYHVTPGKKLVPFLAAGAGGITYDPKDNDLNTDTDLAADYGAGLKYYVSSLLAFRADIRHVFTFRSDDHFSNILYTFGITMVLGKEKPVSAAPPPPQAAP